MICAHSASGALLRAGIDALERTPVAHSAFQLSIYQGSVQATRVLSCFVHRCIVMPKKCLHPLGKLERNCNVTALRHSVLLCVSYM